MFSFAWALLVGMSRQAAAQSNKKEQKAAIAEKNAEKDRLAALGVTPAVKKMIGDDVLMCTECGATKLGPIVCECKGGKKKPPADYCPWGQLVISAKDRDAKRKEVERLENLRKQGEVAKDRSHRKEANELEKNDLEAEFQGDGVEILNIVEFPVGKLGMDVEKNAISKITGAPASDLGVKVGWVISKVNGVTVEPPTKAAIIKEVGKGMKAGPVKFGFRVPITDGFFYCAGCDKCLEEDKFEAAQLSGQGPGKQLCCTCEEFADVGDFE